MNDLYVIKEHILVGFGSYFTELLADVSSSVLFALMQKVRKKIKANPNPSGSLAGLTPPPVGMASFYFNLVGYKQVSERHKCLLVAGTYLAVRGMP